ncbi:hypothetical protein CIHG_01689 [Coccidioides immitis H538.4]|uniref:Uncharacterized protein n=1 Tax=Coccidioides immitis H538.4 TaxID=396776 RepID=A0A0J8RFC2_COCIT|nr:hypothetical protein CIHG_01689 [Coccidioides immitis H538.4]
MQRSVIRRNCSPNNDAEMSGLEGIDSGRCPLIRLQNGTFREARPFVTPQLGNQQQNSIENQITIDASIFSGLGLSRQYVAPSSGLSRPISDSPNLAEGVISRKAFSAALQQGRRAPSTQKELFTYTLKVRDQGSENDQGSRLTNETMEAS